MTQPDLTNLYRTRTEARLQSAGLLLRNNPSCQFEATPEADLARSNIGMMIWSAAIDLGSILLLQETQTTPTGRSPQISQFITRILHPQLPQLRLNVAWSILVQLHNIQHRGGHDPIRFGTAAAAARWSIAIYIPDDAVTEHGVYHTILNRENAKDWFYNNQEPECRHVPTGKPAPKHNRKNEIPCDTME